MNWVGWQWIVKSIKRCKLWNKFLISIKYMNLLGCYKRIAEKVIKEKSKNSLLWHLYPMLLICISLGQTWALTCREDIVDLIKLTWCTILKSLEGKRLPFDNCLSKSGFCCIYLFTIKDAVVNSINWVYKYYHLQVTCLNSF